MICFAGFLQNSCCNNTNKNKITTTKNTECKCGHLTQLRAFTDVKCRVSVLCRETQTTTNFFHFRYYNVKNHIFLRFFGCTSTFFLKVNGNISFGRALSRSPVTHGFFRRFFLLLFGCVLEETHGATFLEVGCEQMIADRHGNFLLRLL